MADLALKVLSVTDTLDPVLDNLDVGAIVDVRNLNRDKSTYVKTFVYRRVKSYIEPWIADAQGLFNVMRNCNAVIGGGVALGIAVAGNWNSDDLDIFTKYGDTYRIRTFLVRHEGYHVDQ